VNTALADVDDMRAPKELSLLRGSICGDVLAPIPGERWVCVAWSGHGPGEHVAEDGTRW
jgi:hypothetical protein